MKLNKEKRSFMIPDLDQIKQKMARYCVYQERSDFQVIEKLKLYSLSSLEKEKIIDFLHKENFLNEERFVNQFVYGKFSIKKWGCIKIRHELKKHRISEGAINHALKRIPKNDYELNISQLLLRKWETLSHLTDLERRQKTINYLQSKGYEIDLIIRCFEQLKMH